MRSKIILLFFITLSFSCERTMLPSPQVPKDLLVPYSPGQPSIQAVSPELAVISWEKTLDQDGTVTSYLVYQEENETFTPVKKTSSLSAVIGSLTPNTRYRFLVKSIDNEGNLSKSSEISEITMPDYHISILTPYSGKVYAAGGKIDISWSMNYSAAVKIELLKENEAIQAISSGLSSETYSYQWDIPENLDESWQYKIRISTLSSNSIKESPSFGIARTMAVLSPNGGEVYSPGEEVEIQWIAIGGGSVSIELIKNNEIVPIVSFTENDGSCLWKIPNTLTEGNGYKIKISTLTSPSLSDSSDTSFSILKTVTLLSPNGNEIYGKNAQVNIQWQAVYEGNVKIELLKNNDFLLNITESTLNNGSFLWDIPSSLENSSEYKIKIVSLNNSSVFDSSDLPFSLVQSLTLQTPNGAESYQTGETADIRWQPAYGGNVKIELLKNHLVLSVLETSYPNTGIYQWNISSSFQPGNDYQIRITLLVQPETKIESAGLFSLKDLNIPQIINTSPSPQSFLKHTEPIRITFNKPVLPDSLILSGFIVQAPYSLQWAKTVYSNDTLIITPQNAWSVGSGKNISLQCSDLYGNVFSSSPWNYDILDGILYVKTDGDDLNPGTFDKPKKTIQKALETASSLYSKAEIHIAEGIYYIHSLNNPLVLKEGFSLYGGYSFSSWQNRNPLNYKTVIQDINDSGGTWDNPNAALYCGNVSVSTIIDGFYFYGGTGDFSAAVSINNSSPVFQNNVIRGGEASYTFGIKIKNTSMPQFINNIIKGSSHSDYSYGIYNESNTTVLLQGNKISGENSLNGSYAIYNKRNTLPGRIENNIIFGGTSAVSFGIMNESSSPVIQNNVINGGNGDTAYGIGIQNGSPLIENNVIFTSTSTVNSYGVIEFSSDSDPDSFTNNNIYYCQAGLYSDADGNGNLTLESDLNQYLKTNQKEGFSTDNASIELVSFFNEVSF